MTSKGIRPPMLYRVNENPHSEWYRGRIFDQFVQPEMVSPYSRPEMVWVDVESTGLDENHEVPLELGIVLTDRVGRVIRNGIANWRIYDNRDGTWALAIDRAKQHPIVGPMHSKSGLFDRIDAELRIAKATTTLNLMLPTFVAADAVHWLTSQSVEVATWPGQSNQAPLSGSSPQFDRKFLNKYLPDLNNWFHYRNGSDVSATRNLQRMLAPGLPEPEKQELHRPIEDIFDSLKLYRHQLYTFLKIDEETRKML